MEATQADSLVGRVDNSRSRGDSNPLQQGVKRFLNAELIRALFSIGVAAATGWIVREKGHAKVHGMACAHVILEPASPFR